MAFVWLGLLLLTDALRCLNSCLVQILLLSRHFFDNHYDILSVRQLQCAQHQC
jgi:hypothetical protein